MKYKIRRTTQFKKDVQKLSKSSKDLEKLLFIVNELADDQNLAAKYKDHPLKGEYTNKRDCHIEPDWILIYAVEDDELVLYRTGTHAQLFQ